MEKLKKTLKDKKQYAKHNKNTELNEPHQKPGGIC